MDEITQQASELSAVDSLPAALERDDLDLARAIITALHPSEIADIIESNF